MIDQKSTGVNYARNLKMNRDGSYRMMLAHFNTNRIGAHKAISMTSAAPIIKELIDNEVTLYGELGQDMIHSRLAENADYIEGTVPAEDATDEVKGEYAQARFNRQMEVYGKVENPIIEITNLDLSWNEDGKCYTFMGDVKILTETDGGRMVFERYLNTIGMVVLRLRCLTQDGFMQAQLHTLFTIDVLPSDQWNLFAPTIEEEVDGFTHWEEAVAKTKLEQEALEEKAAEEAKECATKESAPAASVDGAE